MKYVDLTINNFQDLDSDREKIYQVHHYKFKLISSLTLSMPPIVFYNLCKQ